MLKVYPQHPLWSQIDRQYQFLSSMIDRFPLLVEDWIQKQEREVDDLAKEISGGDPEIYCSEYFAEIRRTESCYNEIDLFNQSMLIMCFSYYESMIYRLSKENGTANRPSSIAEKVGAILDEESQQMSQYLYDTIRPLRNELCHNNNGTLFLEAEEAEKAKVLDLE